mmetsp:Transcript_1309/g.2867  ORF Transcript_1309/g.2867 Transcript_1309/m.2867 type:complete len:225 (-) Transcript_1309:1294-1968(-)
MMMMMMMRVLPLPPPRTGTNHPPIIITPHGERLWNTTSRRKRPLPKHPIWEHFNRWRLPRNNTAAVANREPRRKTTAMVPMRRAMVLVVAMMPPTRRRTRPMPTQPMPPQQQQQQRRKQRRHHQRHDHATVSNRILLRRIRKRTGIHIRIGKRDERILGKAHVGSGRGGRGHRLRIVEHVGRDFVSSDIGLAWILFVLGGVGGGGEFGRGRCVCRGKGGGRGGN